MADFAPHLEPEPFSDDELNASWGAITALRRRRDRRRPYAVAALVFLVGGGVFAAGYLVADRDAPLRLLASPEGATTRLADGSEIALAGGAEVVLARQTRLSLRAEVVRGEATFVVVPVPGKEVVVRAPRTEVHVTGTRFRVDVDRDHNEVTVSVDEGTVVAHAVNGDGDLDDGMSVAAGQTWVVTSSQTTPPRLGASPSAAAPVPAEVPAEAIPEAAPLDAASEQAATLHAAPRRPATPPQPSPPGPDALLARAKEASRAGKFAEAVARYEELAAAYPTDVRAGLAAYEAGRLLHDRLADLRGAAAAYERALRLQPDGSFREDAVARRVQVADSLGATDECRVWKTRYLRDHAGGAYVPTVQESCRP